MKKGKRMDIYENLANAIILQAVKDYRGALKSLQRNPTYWKAQGIKAECERFFYSEWFQTLTSLDGRLLVRKLQQEVTL